MYIFTNVFFGHRISRKLADQSRHVQQHVLQFADLESYGPAVMVKLGPASTPTFTVCRRKDNSLHL
jgi:hypothetical protein